MLGTLTSWDAIYGLGFTVTECGTQAAVEFVRVAGLLWPHGAQPASYKKSLLRLNNECGFGVTVQDG